MDWCVYLLIAKDNRRTYIGASNDPERRLRCHNGELSGGAKSTRDNRPWRHVCIHKWNEQNSGIAVRVAS